MQFDSNDTECLSFRRPLFRLSQLSCLCFVLLFCTVNSATYGQTHQLESFVHQLRNHQGFLPQPRNFGDTPSPTEMMARLKFHKQQETPLFDLLREAGVDIFSKLSDDEKKLAGRFVEDMILKEGMGSDKVSSLMDHMNINDAAKQALQECIKRAGGESAISPEERKTLANKIRQQFLKQLNGSQNPFNSTANRNWPQTTEPRGFPDSSSSNVENRETTSIANGESAATQSIKQQIEEAIKASQRRQDQARRPEQLNNSGADNSARTPSRQPNLQPNLAPDRKLAGRGEQANPHFRLPDIDQNSQPEPPRDAAALPRETTTSPKKQKTNELLAQEAVRQLEQQLSDPQRKVVSELTDKIQNGNLNKQDIGQLLSDLQSSRSPNQLANRLDEASKNLGLPADSRQQARTAFSELSGDQKRSLQHAFNNVNKDMLTKLMDGIKKEQPDTRPSAATSRQTASARNSNTSPANNSQIEDLGREFLQNALETYNDPDSGYELSEAFKRLKDQAEGVQSDRELANLGNISKKLFEDSTKIFNSNSASEGRKKRGLKPGQRFDQLLTSAASKAIAENTTARDKNDDSVFSNVLNQALGVAIDQAVTAADNDPENRSRDVPKDWNQASTPPRPDNFSWKDQARFPEPYDDNTQPFNDATSPTTSNSNNRSSSSAESSIQESAANIGDAISKIKFNWTTLFYAVGLVTLLAGGVYLLSRLMKPVSEAELKQRELQQKLRTVSTDPKDLVQAVDLFLLSRFGSASSWWNANHAANEVSEIQPDWRDKVASLFQVYRRSRYQADGQASVSPEQNELVKSTLQELSQVPIKSFDTTKSSAETKTQSVAVDAEGKS